MVYCLQEVCRWQKMTDNIKNLALGIMIFGLISFLLPVTMFIAEKPTQIQIQPELYYFTAISENGTRINGVVYGIFPNVTVALNYIKSYDNLSWVSIP